MTGPAELLWKMVAPVEETSGIVAPVPLSLNYNVSWACFRGAVAKVNRINQATKTPNSHVVLSAVAGSLHVMTKVVGQRQLDNMNVTILATCYDRRALPGQFERPRAIYGLAVRSIRPGPSVPNDLTEETVWRRTDRPMYTLRDERTRARTTNRRR